jgi:hypothetical protein
MVNILFAAGGIGVVGVFGSSISTSKLRIWANSVIESRILFSASDFGRIDLAADAMVAVVTGTAEDVVEHRSEQTRADDVVVIVQVDFVVVLGSSL